MTDLGASTSQSTEARLWQYVDRLEALYSECYPGFVSSVARAEHGLASPPPEPQRDEKSDAAPDRSPAPEVVESFKEAVLLEAAHLNYFQSKGAHWKLRNLLDAALASQPAAPEHDAASEREVIEALAEAINEAVFDGQVPRVALAQAQVIYPALAARGYRLVRSQPQASDCRNGHDYRLTTDFDGEPIRCARCKATPESADLPKSGEPE